jgi:hypothetical protein
VSCKLFSISHGFAVIMDAQLLIIIALFAAAFFYLVRRVWLTFAAKGQAGCAKGCGGACGAAIDVDALQRTIEARAAGR